MAKIKIEINPEFESRSESIKRAIHEIISSKSTQLSPDGSGSDNSNEKDYIYRGRNNLFRIDIDGLPIIVKDFKLPNFINKFVYTTFRKSKARRSYENALKISSLGFNTPKAVAYCEVKKGCRLTWSFYLSEELTDATEMRRWENNPDCAALLPAFAEEMVRLHRAHVWHKDFSPGNILYVKDEDRGYKFYYVDLNRMKFNVGDDKKLMSMFRSINLDPKETERLARLYAHAAGRDENETVKIALEALEGYFSEQKIKNKFRSR